MIFFFYYFDLSLKINRYLTILISITLFLKYTHAYGASGAWTNTMWPTYSFAASTSSPTPTASATLTFSALATSTATVANLPSVTSCYVGSALTASTLTTQAQTACASTSYFCQVYRHKNIKNKIEFYFYFILLNIKH
jgi:hypothetical protein